MISNEFELKVILRLKWLEPKITIKNLNFKLTVIVLISSSHLKKFRKILKALSLEDLKFFE